MSAFRSVKEKNRGAQPVPDIRELCFAIFTHVFCGGRADSVSSGKYVRYTLLIQPKLVVSFADTEAVERLRFWCRLPRSCGRFAYYISKHDLTRQQANTILLCIASVGPLLDYTFNSSLSEVHSLNHTLIHHYPCLQSPSSPFKGT